jgi:ribosome-binding factor A
VAAPRRLLRLQQLILEVLAETIQQEVQDPRIGMVSITRVRLSPDLSSAAVYWPMLGTEAQRRTTARGLRGALPLLQRRVAETLSTRVTPSLTLRYDEGLERQQRLDDVFRRLRIERGEPPDDPASDPDRPLDPSDLPDLADPSEDADSEAGSDSGSGSGSGPS